jgi:hypothetical protein
MTSAPEPHAEAKAGHRLVAKWLQLVGGVADRQYEQESRNNGPDHSFPRVYERMTDRYKWKEP